MRGLYHIFLLLPLLATAQLKDFEISEMERPDVAVVQANTQWPDDALLLVYSSLKDLNFRSSLGGIDKVTYNPQSNRYEILFKPNKQMLFVYASNFVEQKIETFNPNPKDVFYYKVEQKQQAVVNTKPGTLKIVTEPSGADVFVNGMQMVDKTPFTGELPGASYSIKLQKAKHETIDTTVVVKTVEPTVLNVQMKPTTLSINISSTPSGASVTLDGISRGTTPASFELDLTDRTKRGNKKLQLTLADYETINSTVDLRPSVKLLEKDYSLKKEKGGFNITSTPEGAKVFIGGKYKGVTPLRGSLEVGQYEVEVKLDGYTASKQNLSIRKNDSNELSFAMRDRSSIAIDPAGREYRTVQIGDQLWMAENLAYKPPTGNYWAYQNDPKNVAKYGYLYDWETAKKGCPAGWHMPSDAEWTTLIDYLGGEEVAGTKMKSSTGWENNGKGTDESGFSGLPGGYRRFTGEFHGIGTLCGWWSSTQDWETNAKCPTLYGDSKVDYRILYIKEEGLPVRCLRD